MIPEEAMVPVLCLLTAPQRIFEVWLKIARSM
jgi:hypothetical protein